MSADDITFVQIFPFVGGIAGLLSIAILFIKYLFEKPKLEIIVEDAYYYPPNPSDTANFSEFYIDLRIENHGRRNTTVHSFNLAFSYKGKTYSPPLNGGRTEIVIVADDVQRKRLIFDLQKRQYVIPEGDIENATLEISHTYGRGQKIEIKKIRHG